LKMVARGPGASAEELARFRAEAAAVARLQHPNIVQIFDVGDQAGRPYLALELVDGGNLAQAIAGQPQRADLAAQCLEILAPGIIHRDLKPANILLNTELTAEDAESAERQYQRKEFHQASATSPFFSALSASSAVNSLLKITDFGVAKRLDSQTGLTPSQAI